MKLSWSLRNAALVAAATYLVLLVATAPGRMCELRHCLPHFWDFVGDAVWFVDLEKWQTLFTGGITILAAFIGGWFVKQQIDAAQAQENERRRRVMASARSMMPHTLAALSFYLEECAVRLLAIKRGASEPPAFPRVPSDVLAQLSTMVEASDETTAAPFSRLMSSLQVFESRLRGLPIRASNVDIYISDAMQIHAQTMMLFAFARWETNDPPTTAMVGGQLLSSLNQLGFPRDEFSALHDKAAQLAKMMMAKAPADPPAT